MVAEATDLSARTRDRSQTLAAQAEVAKSRRTSLNRARIVA